MKKIAEIKYDVWQLLASLDPFQSLGSCLQLLRTNVADQQKLLSAREFGYFCRELSEQLIMSRNIHYIVQLYRKKDLIACMPDLQILKNSMALNQAIFVSQAPPVEDRGTIVDLILGQHLTVLPNPRITSATIACAVELYPYDTLCWLMTNKEKAVTQTFVERAAVKTAFGLNPVDIEQFNILQIAKILPKQWANLYKSIVILIAQKNGFSYLKKYEKFLSLPLPTLDLEMRRLHNIAEYLNV